MSLLKVFTSSALSAKEIAPLDYQLLYTFLTFTYFINSCNFICAYKLFHRKYFQCKFSDHPTVTDMDLFTHLV